MHISISLDDQRLHLYEGDARIRSYPISSSAKGMGFQPSSNRTPYGHFVISQKIGDNSPLYTRFQARVPTGIWNPMTPSDEDLILTRILVLDGLDPLNANTRERYIYIHATNREDLIGQAASHGCIRLSNHDMIDLYERVDLGVEILIEPILTPMKKLLFIDCDSTISAIEGIDELARLSDPSTYQKVVALTNSAMNGEVSLDTVFSQRMDIIRPNQRIADDVSKLYIDHIVPGVADFIKKAKVNDWTVIILSGGFYPLIQPLAKLLEIEHIEAVPLYFDENGAYKGYGHDYPTTRNMGKNEIINEWKKATLPKLTVMIGDGISDAETKKDVDKMYGFGGVITREQVKKSCDAWFMDYNESEILDLILNPSI